MIELNVKGIMEEQGITNQSALALELEISRQALRVLRDSPMQRLELKTLENMCRVFDVAPNELLTIKNEDGSVWKPRRLRSTDGKKSGVDKLQRAAAKLDDEIAKQEALKLVSEKAASKKAVDQTIVGLNLAKSIIKALELGLME